MKQEKYYIVIAHRWGNREAHSYFVGLFESESAAKSAAVREHQYRGGKYDCDVIEATVKHTWAQGSGNDIYVVKV